jgi:hypothetical protein
MAGKPQQLCPHCDHPFAPDDYSDKASIRRCSKCWKELPDELFSTGMVIVLRTSDLGRFTIAKSLLEANGIDFVTAGEPLQDIIGGGRLGGTNIAAGPAQLAVRENQAEQVRELLADILEVE